MPFVPTTHTGGAKWSQDYVRSRFVTLTHPAVPIPARELREGVADAIEKIKRGAKAHPVLAVLLGWMAYKMWGKNKGRKSSPAQSGNDLLSRRTLPTQRRRRRGVREAFVSTAKATKRAIKLQEKKLTYKQRKKLSPKDFVFPKERKYPIPDKAHARNALARVAQHGTPQEQKKVKAAVAKKFPDIGEAALGERSRWKKEMDVPGEEGGIGRRERKRYHGKEARKVYAYLHKQGEKKLARAARAVARKKRKK